MRIWDVHPRHLCRSHLLGEHRELHALWNILTQGKKGYRNHPETKRWQGKLLALYYRHEKLVTEMNNRDYQHNSPLDKNLALTDSNTQTSYVDSLEKQRQILMNKNCPCFHSNND